VVSVANNVGLCQPVVEGRDELGLGSLDALTITADANAVDTISEPCKNPHPAVVPGPIVKAEDPSHSLAFNLYDMVAAPDYTKLRWIELLYI
jgi:hypothetical protein